MTLKRLFLSALLLAPVVFINKNSYACEEFIINLEELPEQGPSAQVQEMRTAQLVLQCHNKQASIPSVTSLHLLWEDKSGRTCTQTWQSCGNVAGLKGFVKISGKWKSSVLADLPILLPFEPGAEAEVSFKVDWSDLKSRCTTTHSAPMCL
jgi:hypothetical protein